MLRRRTVFDAFNEAFESRMTSSPSYKEAFQKADADWQRDFGFSAYEDYESFRQTRRYQFTKEKTRRRR